MTFEEYSSDRKTQRAVERCIEVISEASRHIPDEIKGDRPLIPWRDVATIGNVFRHENTPPSRPALSGTRSGRLFPRWRQRCVR
jgi:Protein of unknown function DUF86